MKFSELILENISTNLSFSEENELPTFDENILDIILKRDESTYKIANEKHPIPEYTLILSELRQNLVEWLPMTKTDKVLELGSNYGELTGALAQKAGYVFCFDVDLLRTYINSKRNSRFINIFYYAYNTLHEFEKAVADEKFDYIIVSEVFSEAIQFFPQSENPYLEMLLWIKKLLTNTGKAVIAVDNKYGLKFFNGSRVAGEEFYAAPLTHVTSRPDYAYFTYTQLKGYLQAAGFTQHKIFYPYPDYKFMFGLYSDSYLPKAGELSQYNYTWEYGKINLFSEKDAFPLIAEDGKFSDFSNSYLLIASNSVENAKIFDVIEYIKYAADRNDTLKIRTEIVKQENGRIVRKVPLTRYAKKHVASILESFKQLTAAYSDDSCTFNHCEIKDDAAEFPYIEGVPLSMLIGKWLKQKEYERIEKEYDNLYQLISKKPVYFVPGRKFREIFGTLKTENLIACPISNIDMIPANILIDHRKRYNIIDYEWTFPFAVPVLFIMYRAILYQFVQRDMSSDEIDFERSLYERYRIDQEMKTAFRQMEAAFQKYVTSNRLPLYAYPTIEHINIQEKAVEIFEDLGEGYQRGRYYKIGKPLSPAGRISFDLKVSDKLQKIAIGPSNRKCIVRINAITDNAGNPLKYITNGKAIGDRCYLYKNSAPRIVIENCDLLETELIHVEMVVDILPARIANFIK